MKKTRLLIFISIMVCAIMSLAACNNLPLLATPQDLSADESVSRLSWLNVDGALSYEIETSVDEDTSSTNSFRVSTLGLESSRTYRFRVRAIGSRNEYRPSEWSEPFEIFKPYENGMVFESINGNTEYSLQEIGTVTPDEDGVLEIPSTYHNKPVTQIGDRAMFRLEDSFKKIIVPASVTVIGKEAFRESKSLTEVELPDSVTTIGSYAFYGCTGLKNIKLPEALTAVPQACFSNCTGLGNVTFGNNIVSIGDFAFQYCSNKSADGTITGLTEVRIPNSVISIGKSAFSDALALDTVVFGNNVETIGEQAFVNDTSLQNVTLNEGLLSISTYAFGNCGTLKRISVPNSVLAVETGAFYGCSQLSDVELGDGLRTLGSGAFYGTPLCPAEDEDDNNYDCKDAYYVDGWLLGLPNNKYAPKTNYQYNQDGSIKTDENGNQVILSVETHLYNLEVQPGTVGIAELAFYWYPAIKYTLNSDGEQVVDDAAFCGLQTITLPDSLKYINANAFRMCANLTEVYFGSGLEAIDNGAFEICPYLERLEFKENSPLSVIGNYAFNSVPRGLEKPLSDYIKERFMGRQGDDGPINSRLGSPYAGEGSGIHDLNLPSSLKEVGAYAFYGSFYYVYYRTLSGYSDNVVYVGGWAVGTDEEGVEYINVAATQPDGKPVVGISNYAFVDGVNIATATLPTSSSAFKYLGMGAFSGCMSLESIEIPDGITEIYPSTFYGCTMLSEITLPSSIRKIDELAFYNCGNALEVQIDEHNEKIGGMVINGLENVTSIGDFAFYGCSTLYDVTFNSDLEALGAQSFCRAGIKEVTLPGTLSEIKQFAFSNCTDLESVTIEEGVKNIDRFAFRNCTALSEINIPRSVRTIGESAFRGCSNLVLVRFAEGLESIGNYAFYGCSVLGMDTSEAIVLPNSLTSIGDYAFRSCTLLRSMILGDSIKSMGMHVFNRCELLVIYTDMTSIPEGWNTKWNSSFRPIFKGCTLSDGRDYVISFVKDEDTLENYFTYYLDNEDAYGEAAAELFSSPVRSSSTFNCWIDKNGNEYTAEELKNVPDGTLLTADWLR